MLLLLPINGGACVSRVAARLLATGGGWVDMFNLIATRRYSTSAYCYLLPLRMVVGIGGYWILGGDMGLRGDCLFRENSWDTLDIIADIGIMFLTPRIVGCIL